MFQSIESICGGQVGETKYNLRKLSKVKRIIPEAQEFLISLICKCSLTCDGVITKEAYLKLKCHKSKNAFNIIDPQNVTA
jgi:hypothetical protein